MTDYIGGFSCDVTSVHFKFNVSFESHLGDKTKKAIIQMHININLFLSKLNERIIYCHFIDTK